MRKSMMTLLTVMLIYNTIFGQDYIAFTFEQDTNYKKYFFIDSSDVNNIWQIGKPVKSMFASALSIPNAIVTDTLNAYPPNNESSFTIIHVISEVPVNISMEYQYQIQSDSLNDTGMIKCSFNNGLSWIELNPDSTQQSIYWWSNNPQFSGNSHGWKWTKVDIIMDTPYSVGDTVLFKFVFKSGNNVNNKDG